MGKRLAGVALAASLLTSVLGVPSAVAGGPSGPYNAYCYSASGFQNTTNRTRTFGYVWRAGTTVLGYGSVRLAPNATFADDTPVGAEKFGVVTNSTVYAYVNC